MAQADHRYRIPAYRGGEPFAFVSYSHEDSALVFAELEALAAEGLRFYYDEGIHPGHTWDDELADAHRALRGVRVLRDASIRRTSPNCRRENRVRDRSRQAGDRGASAGRRAATGLELVDRQSPGDRAFRVSTKPRYRERLIAAIREHVGQRSQKRCRPAATPARVPAAKRTRRWLIRRRAAAARGRDRIRRRRITGATPRLTRSRSTSNVTKIEQLVQQDQYGAAFTLAHPLIEEDSGRRRRALAGAVEADRLPGTPIVAEAGATLSYAAYDDADDATGSAPASTPIEAAARPAERRGAHSTAEAGISDRRIRRCESGAEREVGAVARERLPEVRVSVSGLAARRWRRTASSPNDMVLVPATDEPMYLDGAARPYDGLRPRALPEFAISKYEVTNREYKEFVDAGGYDNPTYWDGLEFRDDGKTLDWAEARARFVDRTGRPGPAGWELSVVSVGRGRMPVGGISWYEAVAYARFRHLSLPTIHHWTRAAFGPFEGVFETAPAIAAASRFLADGPVEARSEMGLGPWGTWNTAGNACEWVWNFVGAQAAVLGGCVERSRPRIRTRPRDGATDGAVTGARSAPDEELRAGSGRAAGADPAAARRRGRRRGSRRRTTRSRRCGFSSRSVRARRATCRSRASPSPIRGPPRKCC